MMRDDPIPDLADTGCGSHHTAGSRTAVFGSPRPGTARRSPAGLEVVSPGGHPSVGSTPATRYAR